MITQKQLKKTLSYDPATGVFTWIVRRSAVRLGMKAGAPDTRGYVHIRIDQHTYSAHRLAWLYVQGKWPAGSLDHINGNQSDNRISNLRLASNSQNIANSRLNSRNTSGFKGVHWHKPKQRWRAGIKVNGKNITLGTFRSPQEAHQCYCDAARKAFGEFARLE